MARVTFKGPMFDGRAEGHYRRMVDEIEEAVAQEGEDIVQDRLSRVLQNPTGRYQSRIQTDRTASGRMVHDSKMIYGRWLEGVNEQNKTTRFKGYHTFKIATWHLLQRVKVVTMPVVAKYVRKMNGR